MPEARQARPAQQQEQGSAGFLRTIVQSVGMFIVIQAATKYFMSPAQPADPSTGAVAPGSKVQIPAYSERPHHLSEGAAWNPIPQSVTPMWPVGTELDILMYISASVAMPQLKSMPKDSLLIDEKKFKFGDWKENREIHTEFAVPKEVQNNATLFAHFYVAQSGNPADPTVSGYNPSKAYHFIRPLTQYIPKKKVAKTRNLLAGTNETEQETADRKENESQLVASYYHPNFTISMIPDSGVINYPTVHPGVRAFIQLERTGARDSTGQHGWYYPILFTNQFWQLKKQMTEVNSTVTRLPLNVKLNNLNNWKFSLFAAMDEGLKQQAAARAAGQTTPGGGDGSEIEMFKEILLDSNSYLLALTAIVSVFHMVFEMLAFKNDVAHWRKKKDNVGTSVRTILANVFMQTIIFLYLMDNNENTSWMILFGQGMGIVIEAWKVTKMVNVRVRPTAPGSLFPYAIVFEDKHALSETEKKTQEYDEIAFKYMYMLAVPLLLAYAGYSLVYETHKSWYSFLLATLVGSVYAYGFLMMVPSLYINYRLKSVAHMPGRAMTYKLLNTFIDDLFAFTIKMPTLHRLATLRDDVIFFVYLYQTWVYKVDYSRVNEFGQGGDDEEVEEKIANKPLTAAPAADGSVDVKIPDVGGVVDEIKAKVTGSQKKGDGRKRK